MSTQISRPDLERLLPLIAEERSAGAVGILQSVDTRTLAAYADEMSGLTHHENTGRNLSGVEKKILGYVLSKGPCSINQVTNNVDLPKRARRELQLGDAFRHLQGLVREDHLAILYRSTVPLYASPKLAVQSCLQFCEPARMPPIFENPVQTYLLIFAMSLSGNHAILNQLADLTPSMSPIPLTVGQIKGIAYSTGLSVCKVYSVLDALPASTNGTVYLTSQTLLK